MQITQNPSPNFNRGRSGHVPDMICCHITEGAFNGAVSWVTNPASQVSYHFLVAADGRIVQAVDMKDTAWANGTTNDTGSRGNQHSTLQAVRDRRTNANNFTISIGFEGFFAQTSGSLTDKQFEAGVWLIGHIRDQVKAIYNLTIPINTQHIVGHSHITPRWKPNCPGPKFPYQAIIDRLTAAPPAPQPSPWAKTAWAWATGLGITDGTNPQGAPTREQMVQLLYNYHHRAK